MRFLLDTKVFLWMAIEPARLSRLARATVGDLANELVVSAVTPWEIGTAVNKGRLNLGQQWATFYARHLSELGASSIAVELEHAIAVAALPLIHRDPFDRMLAAQSIVEQIPVVSNDTKIRDLGATLIW